jgi:hypothetical protein
MVCRLQERTARAIELMAGFGERTGLTSRHTPQRYLWTDAFAVCNFLGLGVTTGESRYVELALGLVEQVHRVLGHHRRDDGRTGWISGLDEASGEAHPTRGGLRIGKPLPERTPDERIDERLEWDRDGQYFHYLTKWMHALDQVARATGQPMFNGWARELADVAHRAFTYAPRVHAPKRMYWKLSVDLSRPLVASMGQHDPLDGFVTCSQLAVSPGPGPDLQTAIADFAAMVDPHALVTADPLGLGGLLTDACRLAQLAQRGAIDGDELVEVLLAAAEVGLRHYASQQDPGLPAEGRLAFRELGLAIGLAALEADVWRSASNRARSGVDRLSWSLPLRAQIETFWLQPERRRAPSWLEHANINDVMLATCLRPDGFLLLSPGSG